MNCWHCGTELIWGGDHDYEDGEGVVEGSGIVSNFSCPSCPAIVYTYLPLDGDFEFKVDFEEESTETVEGFVCELCGEEIHGEGFVRSPRMTITCGDCYDKGSSPC
jgi:predicted RNA-binding Zn-ribbon protein involved in translation (DUF1610 family)